MHIYLGITVCQVCCARGARVHTQECVLPKNTPAPMARGNCGRFPGHAVVAHRIAVSGKRRRDEARRSGPTRHAAHRLAPSHLQLFSATHFTQRQIQTYTHTHTLVRLAGSARMRLSGGRKSKREFIRCQSHGGRRRSGVVVQSLANGRADVTGRS